VGISYGDSTDKAIEILRGLVENEPRFLKEPAPQFFVAALADSSVNVSFRAWVRNSDYFDLLWMSTDEVKRRFDEAGITIPFPQRTVHLVQADAP
jgi:small conductance mechanosensitive channel